MAEPTWWIAGVLCAVRAAGFVALLPTPGGTHASWQARGALVVLFTLLLAPARLPFDGSMGPLSLSLPGCVAELSAGLLVGFAVRAIWTALAWNAELIAQQAGLMGSPAANDDLPESPLARLYGLVALAVLFAGGGHRLVLAALLAEPMPPTMGGDELAAAAGRMLMAASELAVRVATPAALAVWAGTFATAMAARTLPRIVLGQTTLPVPLMLVLAAAAASISAVPSAVRIAVTWLERLV